MPRYFFDVTNSNTLGKNSNLFKPREDMLWQRHGNCHDTNCRARAHDLAESARADCPRRTAVARRPAMRGEARLTDKTERVNLIVVLAGGKTQQLGQDPPFG